MRRAWHTGGPLASDSEIVGPPAAVDVGRAAEKEAK